MPFLAHGLMIEYVLTISLNRLSAGLYAGAQIMELYKRYGFPKFTSAYGAQVASDPAIIKIFLGSMLAFLPRQYMFCIAPVLLSEATYFMKEIFEV